MHDLHQNEAGWSSCVLLHASHVSLSSNGFSLFRYVIKDSFSGSCLAHFSGELNVPGAAINSLHNGHRNPTGASLATQADTIYDSKQE